MAGKITYTAQISQGGGKEIALYSLQLSSLDNEPAYFWQNFLRNLAQWDALFVQTYQEIPTTEQQTDRFIQAMLEAARAKPFILAAFGYQCITGHEVQWFLQRLLGPESQHFKLILIHTKNGAALNSPIAAAFSAEEEARYYIENGVRLTADQLARVRVCTEGWPGLVGDVAWLLAQGRQVESIVNALDKHMYRYMDLKYFSLYTEAEKKALLCLSLLEGFTLDMASEVTGVPFSMFVELLEENPSSYYNRETGFFYFRRAYREFLRNNQALLEPQDKTDFFCKVAYWHLNQGDRGRAIQYYSMAGEHGRVLEIMESTLHYRQYKCELFPVYIEAIRAMPEVFKKERPIILVIYCYIQNRLHNYWEVDRVMQQHLPALREGAQGEERTSILGECYLLWAMSLQVVDRPRSVEKIRLAEKYLPDGSRLWDKHAGIYGSRIAANLASPAKGELARHIEWVKEYAPLVYDRIVPDLWRGLEELAAAEAGYLTLQMHDVELNANRAIMNALVGEQYDIACNACLLLMRYYVYIGKFSQMVESLTRLKGLAANAPYDFFPLPDMAEASYLLVSGKGDQMADWLKQGFYPGHIHQGAIGMHWVYRAHYLLHKNRFGEAIAYLETGVHLCKEQQRNILAIQLHSFLGPARFLAGRKEEAQESLRYLYFWTHENQIYSPILEVSAYIKPLLEYGIYKKIEGVPQEWMKHLLDMVKQYVHRNSMHGTAGVVSPMEGILASLSARELELLEMLQTELTRIQIAEKLGISDTTARSTCSRLYRKLGVKNRKEAIKLMQRLLPAVE